MKPFFVILFTSLLASNLHSQCAYQTSVPKEFYRNRYQPADAVTTRPFTLFNKNKPNWNLEADLELIRANIKKQINVNGESFGFALLYKKIYEEAVKNEPGKCMIDQEECPHPIWVKNNAVVNLIGLKYERENNRDVFFELDQADKDGFGWRAKEGLRNLNPEVSICINNLIVGCNKISRVALNLLYYLQAYDLLKTSGYLPPNDDDRNTGDCSARNKLREFTRNLYIQSNGVINSTFSFKKNHGIICASVLGVAAIVLWDAGTGLASDVPLLAHLNPFVLVSRIFSPPPRPNYNPQKWMARCLGKGHKPFISNPLRYAWGTFMLLDNKEDGLEDNMFKGHRIFTEDVPMTSPDGKAGYAEGPGYAQYAFRALLPFLRTQANFHADPKNALLYDSRYREVINWAFNIQTYFELNPTYDNTIVKSFNLVGILGEDDWPSTSVAVDVAYYADFLFANGATPNGTITHPGEKLTKQYVNSASGNAILRALDDRGDSHYIQLLAEKNYAVDNKLHYDLNTGFIPNWFASTHEDEDEGSFTIMADNQQLAIDPPYMRWGTHHLTNKRYHHNIVRISDYNDATVTSDFRAQPNAVEVDLSLGLQNKSTRLIKSYKSAGRIYYLLEDRCENLPSSGTEDFHLLINGNGRDAENSFVQTNLPNGNESVVGGRIFKWWHPCNNTTNTYKWGLLAHAAVMNTGNNKIFANYTGSDYVHGSGENYITNIIGYKDRTTYNMLNDGRDLEASPVPFGEHNRMHITIENTNKALFQTLLLPYRCNIDEMPTISRQEFSNYVNTIVRFPSKADTSIIVPSIFKASPAYVTDIINDIHTAQMDNQTITVNDSITGLTLTSNARNTYVSFGNFELLRSGACAPSITKFKKAEIQNGQELIINNKRYIYATSNAAVFIERVGKFKYSGFVKTDNPLSVTFKLADAEYGIKLVAKQGTSKLPTNHFHLINDADSFQLMKVDFADGLTEFTIELDDLCLANCFFPPTHEPIDTLLHFDTGSLETLGHDLDIIKAKGEFHILKGSKMSICPDFVFNNKDSLILYALDNEIPFPFANKLDGPTTLKTVVRERIVSKRSMIIVNEKAALVLDSGSFTHVGDNATILVLKGGTLLIRKGATVEIGGNESSSEKAFGEIIAEEGAFVCIEDSSSIYFFKDTLRNDTIDNNIFYVSLEELNPTFAGTNPDGGRGKFSNSPDANGIYSNTNCLSFCNVKNVLPPFGIQNRDWGWCNFSRPKIKQVIPPFICESSTIYINPNKILNETWYKITIEKNGIKIFDKTSTFDSIKFSGLRLPPLHKNENYTLKMFVLNDCKEGDTLILNITIPDLPQPKFVVNKTACEGTGSVFADGRLSANNHPGPMDYVWFIQKLNVIAGGNDTFYYPAEDNSMEWLFTNKTQVDSAFNFPGYKWIGGFKYVIGLTIKGICFDSTAYDTINVPFGVSITAEEVLSANQLLANPSIQLNGTASQTIISFNWSNETKLFNSNTLNPLTNTTDSITTYIFTASNGQCSASDTISIRYNNYLFIGNDTFICRGTPILLGNRMEESLLFGLLGTIDYSTFNNYFDNYINSDPLFTKNFGLALLSDQYKLWTKIKTSHKDFFDIISLYKDSFYRHPNYISAYQNYLTKSLSGYMDYFKNNFIDYSPELKNLISSIVVNYNNANGTEAFENLLSSTFNAVMTDYNNYPNPVGEIRWFVNGIEEPSLYGQLLTHQSYDSTTHLSMLLSLNNTIEYDEITIEVDSTLYPLFTIGFMHDSTVYFGPIPNSPGHLKYLWQFGDNSTSNLKNPIHTYPEFNREYYVCLTVYNSCNEYTFCDTLMLDSNLLNLFQLGKRANTPEPDNKPTQQIPNQNVSMQMDGIYLSNNIPNPFDESTIIDYEVIQPTNDLKLMVTNALGQQKLNIPLHQNKGRVNIHKDNLDRGVYYYYLIVNGMRTQAKIMLVK